MIIGCKSDVFHPWKERIHDFQFEISWGMHACHILSYCPNERLQSGIIFSILVAFSPFMSHLVTQLKLPTLYTHTPWRRKANWGGKTPLLKNQLLGGAWRSVFPTIGPLYFADWDEIPLLMGKPEDVYVRCFFKIAIWASLSALNSQIFQTVQI